MTQQELTKDMNNADFSASGTDSLRRQKKWIVLIVVASAAVTLLILLSFRSLYERTFSLGFNSVSMVESLQITEYAAPATRPQPTPQPIFYPPLEVGPQFIEFQTAERLNVLLLGSDGRPDEQDFPRTDSLMLLSWDRENNIVDLLSLPRDLWVPVPRQFPTKINLVYSIGEHESWGGGVTLLIDTIEALINQPVHHYLWLNFDGFINIVDQIGGIPIYVPWAINDEKYPTADYGHEIFELDAGYHILDGATALKYARTRTQDGDFNRIGRQQDVVYAFIRQVTDPANSARLLLAAPDILRSISLSFQSDLTIAEVLQLARQVSGVPQIGATLVIDSNMGVESYSDEGMWVLMPDRPQIRAAFQEFFQVKAVNLP